MRKIVIWIGLILLICGCTSVLDGYKNPYARFSCKVPKGFFIKGTTDYGSLNLTIFESSDGKTKIFVSYIKRNTDDPVSPEGLKSFADALMSDRLRKPVSELAVVSLSGREEMNDNRAVWYEYDKDNQKVYSEFLIRGSSSYDISFSFESGTVDREMVSLFLKNFKAL